MAPSLIKTPRKLALFILRAYSNYLSYFFPANCRFYPSCSHYAQDAIKTHGIIFGFYYSVRRLLRCHPWHQGGYDPVPEKTNFSSAACCAKRACPQTLNLTEDSL